MTGLLNIQYDDVFGFGFDAAHYVGAWAFLGAFVAHVALKLRTWCAGDPVAARRAAHLDGRHPAGGARPVRPRRSDPGGADDQPARRARVVGGGSPPVAGPTAGQPSAARCAAWRSCCPRAQLGRRRGGPNDFPVSKMFAVTGTAGALGARWRLDLTGGAARPARPRRRAAQRSHRDAPDRVRRGLVDDRDLDRGPAARPRGAGRRARIRERGGALAGERPVRAGDAHVGQVLHPDALLALGVNGRHSVRTTATRPGSSSGAARRAQHQVGPLDRVPELLMRHRFRRSTARAPATSPSSC